MNMDNEIKNTIRHQFFKRNKYAILIWLALIYIFSLYLAGSKIENIALSNYMSGFLMFIHLFLLLFANQLSRFKQGYVLFSLQVMTTAVIALLITSPIARLSWLVGFIPVLVIEEMTFSGKIKRRISPALLIYIAVILAFGMVNASLADIFFLLEAIVAVWFVAAYYCSSTYTRLFQTLQLKQVNEELNEAYHEVARLTAEEIRQKMARELHDTITQDLVGINFQLTAVKMFLDKKQLDNANEKIKLLQQMTQAAITQSRETITRYRQLPDNEVTTSLKYKVLEKAQLLKAKYQLQTTLEIPENIELGGELLIDVVRIINEALMNVVKHAKVNQATVQAKMINDCLIVRVHNDGETFTNQLSQSSNHYGLIGMRERAQAHGGDIKISSTPKEGTSVMIEIKVRGDKK
ncbi:MAG: sensor histidine kinase [Lactobacillus sp.]|jgi:NarL family two-component system sensor histidine kinase YdfH|nr:sensor histidine kinase [Lactobacillus sp.]